MAAPVILGSIAAAGAVVGAYGAISGAQNQKEAMERELALKRQQADEIIGRQEVNEQILRERGLEMADQYQADFAGTGREGAGIGGALRIRRDVENVILDSRREAKFKAEMLRAGANIDMDLMSDRVTGSYLTGAGTVLTGAYNVYSQFKPASSSVASLPKTGGT